MMHATMMNFPYLPRQSLDGDSSFSPSTTPSPPGFFTKRPGFFPYYPPKFYRLPELQPAPRSIKRKDFTIEAILGLTDDSDGGAYDERPFAGGPVRSNGRDKASKPYAVPEATPRSSLTALLPSSPEKSPEKYDSKCKSHRGLKEDSSPDNHLYDILTTTTTKTSPGGCNHPSNNLPKSPSSSSHGGGKMKRIRTIFTPEQLERLESEFERQQYMVGPERLYLASTLSLSESQVKIWFQNRRIKWRKQHLEMQQARLAQMRESEDATECDQEQDQSNNLRDSSPPVQHWEDC